MISGNRALVVGGTGPTGGHVIAGLQERGYDVTLLHRGLHDRAEPEGIEHIHADPHFAESLADGLGGREFEVVVATYGRLRIVAETLATRCGAFVGVSGVPAYSGYHEPTRRWPRGMPIPAAETDAPDDQTGVQDAPGEQFSLAIRRAEERVLEIDANGGFAGAVFRYASIYGPWQLYPREWSVVKRVLDGRAFIILPDGGLTINSRCAARNAAHFLLLAVDRMEAARGRIFNAADSRQYSLRQWVQLASTHAGRELVPITIPFDLAGPGRGLFPVPHTDHCMVSIRLAEEILGYQDAVSPEAATREAVEFLIANPPSARVVDGMADRFDYEQEDAIVAAYQQATKALLAHQEAAPSVAHPYAHPLRPGSADHRGR